MMFNFDTLTLENFKCFIGKHEYTLPKSGLVFLTGTNKVNTNLGSNGVGKSTIADAMCWCLYGKTPRGVSGASLLPWDTDRTDITVTLVLNERIITRFWSSTRTLNTLTVDGDVITDAELVSGVLKGLSMPAFLHTVVHPQYGETFLRMTPTVRSALISQCVQLDTWIEYAAKASKKVPDLKNKLGFAQRSVATFEGHINALKDQDFSSKQKQWDIERAGKILLITKEVKRLIEKQTEQADALDAVADLLLSTSERLSILKKKQQRIEEDLDVARESFTAIQNKVFVKRERLNNAEEKYMHALAISKNGQCPSCYQNVTEDFETNVLNEILLKKEKTDQQLELITQKLEVAKHKKDRTQQKRDALQDRIIRTQRRINEIQHKIQSHERCVKTLDRDRERLKEELAEHERLKNPFAESNTKNLQDLEEKRHAVRLLNRRVHDLTEELSIIRMWSKGFKEVRGLVIDTVITMYQSEVTNVLSNLGMQGWNVFVTTDTESRGVTSGIYLEVLPPNTDKCHIDSFSGGESTRIELALEMALSNLIQSYLGVSTSIEIWDEPSNYLNAIDDVVALLSDRSKSQNAAMVYVDHRDATDIQYDKTLTIVKDKTGSVIQ